MVSHNQGCILFLRFWCFMCFFSGELTPRRVLRDEKGSPAGPRGQYPRALNGEVVLLNQETRCSGNMFTHDVIRRCADYVDAWTTARMQAVCGPWREALRYTLVVWPLAEPHYNNVVGSILNCISATASHLPHHLVLHGPLQGATTRQAMRSEDMAYQMSLRSGLVFHLLPLVLRQGVRLASLCILWRRVRTGPDPVPMGSLMRALQPALECTQQLHLRLAGTGPISMDVWIIPLLRGAKAHSPFSQHAPPRCTVLITTPLPFF